MQRPVHQLRSGRVSAAIWANRLDENRVVYNVTFERSYKQDGVWKSTRSFGHDDLPVLAKLADMAFMWVIDAMQRPDGVDRPRREPTESTQPDTEPDEIPF